jgi:hypothetical protein
MPTLSELATPLLEPDRYLGAPPCFYFEVCGRPSSLEKQGKAVCSPCAAHFAGREYPLRPPTREPLYDSSRAAAKSLGMLEPRRHVNTFDFRRRSHPFSRDCSTDS